MTIAHRLLAFVLCLSAWPVFAASRGSAFSGPTMSDGASSYYAPAAIAKEKGISINLDAELWFVGASFERAGIDPNTGLSYEKTGFLSVSPNLSFIVGVPTPLDWLRFSVLGFAPTAAGSRWDEDSSIRHSGTNATIVGYVGMLGPVFIPHPKIALSVMGGVGGGFVDLVSVKDFGAFINAADSLDADVFPLEDPRYEGDLSVEGSGWFAGFNVSLWTQPLSWLEFAASFHWFTPLHLAGELSVETPPALEGILPGYGIANGASFSNLYPIPWKFSTELRFLSSFVNTAITFQYANKSDNAFYVTEVTGAEFESINGKTLSVTGEQNDFQVGLRLDRKFGKRFEGAFRFDYDFRGVETRYFNATNLGFHTLEFMLGARMQITSAVNLSLSYAFLVPLSENVTDSIFNPRAPASSGLGAPSANGLYEAGGHKIIVGLKFSLGQLPSGKDSD